MKSVIFIIFFSFVSIVLTAQNGKSEKRGIAYGYHSEADMAAIAPGLSWWYNWGVQPESSIATVYANYDMDFVPMTWNNGFNETALRNFYSSHPDAKYLLAFNEPNFTSQANMKPSVVAAAWHRLESIASDYNLEIVGPAVNWCGNCVSEGGVTFTNPYEYLDSFFSACPDCKVDYIAVHNYMCYAGALSAYIDGFKKYGKKIWLTEFACMDQSNITLDMQKSYMKGALDYLENDSMIFRYSWFIGRSSTAYPYNDIFAAQSGQLSELGQFYVDYHAYIPDTSYYRPVPDRIEAENFTSMYGIQTQTVSDFDGFDNVGWVDPGDWLEYNIDIPADGGYFLYTRIASNASTSLIFKLDGSNTDTLKVPYTGGWQSWKTLEMPVQLPSGKHKLMIYAPSGNFNLNWIRISDHKNNLPVVNAGADQIIYYPETSTSLVSDCSDLDGDKLSYKWTKASGPSSFEIKQPSSAETDVSGLVKGKYTFRLTASDGTDIVSDLISVELAFAAEAGNVREQKLSVYPNPFRDKLLIKNPFQQKDMLVTITDPAGRQIYSATFSKGDESYEINTSGLQAGMYIISISDGTKIFKQTIIKAVQ
ncbi:MAG: carbohydrate-binding protein [Bacteroidales bacterium]|nr:carbohydrate-binding protein [Bacteroidales bacterium]